MPDMAGSPLPVTDRNRYINTPAPWPFRWLLDTGPQSFPSGTELLLPTVVALKYSVSCLAFPVSLLHAFPS